MPGGDGTGPLGQGPMTGRAMGYCAGYSVPRFMNPGFGRGFWRRGFGRGRGSGWRWRFTPIAPTQPQQVWEPIQVQPQVYQPAKEQEMQMLEDERKAIEQEQEVLKQELEEIRKRIEELKKNNKVNI